MTATVRLLTLLRTYRWRVALAIVLGCATIASTIGLLATAAYLIAAAALKPLLVTLAFPIYLVRLFGVSRAFSRYAERLVSHHVTLTLLAEVRTWFYSRLEPLAPARLLEYRSGDVLARITKDVDELENIFQRVFSPTIVALMTSLLTCGLLYIFRPVLAFVAGGFLVAAGLIAAGASLLFGSGWLSALAPFAHRHAGFAVPTRLAQLGLPEWAASLVALAPLAVASPWLVRSARAGRPRLALTTILILLASPWVLPWYAVWAVPLAAVEEDRAAWVLSLALCAYLLPDRVPL